MSLGLTEALFLVFLVLKLLGVTAVAGWSWWWVTAPLWIGGAIDLAVLLLVGITAFRMTAAKR
ncbi:hypothetical protein [Williamsia deligens]|uniref:Transmembrane Fragile-X-F protein n=1 Tax=Williamsia deligens TaxID=321325 RepID=A0ABW3GEV5_9NOCA|nr:hypothetical protein [Williamsia deligens]MCP2196331.1 hypothetical protein [Williamsia deligens]